MMYIVNDRIIENYLQVGSLVICPGSMIKMEQNLMEKCPVCCTASLESALCRHAVRT